MPAHRNPIVRFFDKFEDRVRARLSNHPIIYSLIGSVGIVLIWKGIWEWAAEFPILFGPASILLGVLILLPTGLLVSFFVGDSIILSGRKHEKKLAEKTELELIKEETATLEVMERLSLVEQELRHLTKAHTTNKQ